MPLWLREEPHWSMEEWRVLEIWLALLIDVIAIDMNESQEA